MTLNRCPAAYNAGSPMGMVLTVEDSVQFVKEVKAVIDNKVPGGTANPAAGIEDEEET